MLAIAIHAVQWACDAWKSWCEEASGRVALPMFAQRQELGRLIKANPQPEKKDRTQYVLKRPAAKVSKKPAAKVSEKPAAANAKKAATCVRDFRVEQAKGSVSPHSLYPQEDIHLILFM